ncbi:nucleoid-associated protein [Pedobacter alluvionis]|uniref:Nucleoid-associated protein YejK n=1 Tax=Pedobacter alluvionis TaxID=475253 RepID=A0A497Y0U3_9SPHI|nr:nucleoid-associated protein [Pedobacter alluvionis]RLJ73670.1 nucleoid-associated protein YejK [Pedobacter alluvionis]TFB32706.1 hypothetical protein E3V97_01320 [Pedobacter alluvionis]
MNVRRIIIHELVKEAGSNQVSYNSSQELLLVNDGINKLIEQVHNAFDQSITKYSKFDLSKPTNSVYLNVDRYLREQDNDGQFFAFSTITLGDLAQLIEREPFATGGYYLYVDYEVNGYRYISIIIVRNKEAFNIQWRDGNFSIDETQNVNIDKLAMGFRLNCTLYLDGDNTRNYLGLLSHQGDNLSKYFLRWVNVGTFIDNKTNTRQFIDVLKDIGAPQDYPRPDDFERDIFEWISSYKKANKNVLNVDLLSDAFYGDKLYIRNYAQERFRLEIDPLFHLDGTELRRLITYKAKAKGISVTIDIERFISNDVVLRDGLLIIKDEKIYSTLTAQREEE